MEYSTINMGLPTYQLIKMFAVLTLLIAGCKKEEAVTYQPGKVTVEFENVAGSVHLDVFGTTNYTNSAGEVFSVTKLKYYVSNIAIEKEDGTYYTVPSSYHLIDESVSTKHSLSLLNIPGGVYKGLQFTIGVDSTRTANGPFTGDLDTTAGMYWNNAKGYIFLSVEGQSAASPTGQFIYHVGGDNQSNSALRTITIPFSTDSKLTVDGSRQAEVHLLVNIYELFKNPVDIKIADYNTIDQPGNDAIKLSINYMDMFSFYHIHN